MEHLLRDGSNRLSVNRGILSHDFHQSHQHVVWSVVYESRRQQRCAYRNGLGLISGVTTLSWLQGFPLKVRCLSVTSCFELVLLCPSSWISSPHWLGELLQSCLIWKKLRQLSPDSATIIVCEKPSPSWLGSQVATFSALISALSHIIRSRNSLSHCAPQFSNQVALSKRNFQFAQRFSMRDAPQERSSHGIASSPTNTAIAVTTTNNSPRDALITQKPILKRNPGWLGFDDARFIGYENQGDQLTPTS